jgi:cell division protein FtsW
MKHALPVLNRRQADATLFAVAVALSAIGLVMVYSASSVVAYDRLADSAYFLKRQAAWTALGLAALWLTRGIHYQRLRAFTAPALALAALMLVAVQMPGIGRLAGGARRWLVLGPITFQPVELAKLALVFYLAHFLAQRGPEVRHLRRGVAPPVAITAGLAALVLRQPDMGSAMVLGAVTISLLFAAGARIAHLLLVGLAAVPAVGLAILVAPYRFQRVLAFLDPWRDSQGAGFHIIQSLVAFGSGGVFGVGLGASRQKFFYLPERHTDFIFAILGEELGLLGTLGVLGLFGLFIYRGCRIARAAPDRYGALLALGITANVAGQALMNMGVSTGLLPVTGVPLPFLSFGGTSLVTTMIEVGVLLNISQYARGSPRVGAPSRPRAVPTARALEPS